MVKRTLNAHLALHFEKNAIWLAQEACRITPEDLLAGYPTYQLVGFFRYVEEEQANTWVKEGGIIDGKSFQNPPEEGFPIRTLTMLTRIDPRAAQPIPGTRRP